MSLYTAMPLEAVLDGFNNEPGPFVDLTFGGVTMRVVPVAPGIGRIERLLSAPLNYYLREDFAPGRMVCYAEPAASVVDIDGSRYGDIPLPM